MKPERFSGQNFRRWQTRAKFWLMSLGLWWVIHPQYPFTIDQYMQFDNANNTALGCILTILADQLYDVYMDYKSATELWDTLEHKYAEAEARRWLYMCEQFFDFSMDEAKSIVGQAHDLQLLVGEIARTCRANDLPLPLHICALVHPTTLWRTYSPYTHRRADLPEWSECSQE